MKKAVFLDRDGTLIEDRGCIAKTSEVFFLHNVFEALRKLRNSYELFIVTNQPGIAKGIISMNEVENINNHIRATLRSNGVNISEMYVCPHKREDECECIKPRPFFLKKAAAIHNIDLYLSFSIGDHPHDAEFAQRAGGLGIYILTGHGKKHLHELARDIIVLPNIYSAAEWITSGQTRTTENLVKTTRKKTILS